MFTIFGESLPEYPFQTEPSLLRSAALRSFVDNDLLKGKGFDWKLEETLKLNNFTLNDWKLKARIGIEFEEHVEIASLVRVTIELLRNELGELKYHGVICLIKTPLLRVAKEFIGNISLYDDLFVNGRDLITFITFTKDEQEIDKDAILVEWLMMACCHYLLMGENAQLVPTASIYSMAPTLWQHKGSSSAIVFNFPESRPFFQVRNWLPAPGESVFGIL